MLLLGQLTPHRVSVGLPDPDLWWTGLPVVGKSRTAKSDGFAMVGDRRRSWNPCRRTYTPRWWRMIRVSETKDRFDLRAERFAALLRDAGVSEHGPRTARPTFPIVRGPHRSPNVVIDWLSAKSLPLAHYLRFLKRFDLCLQRSLGRAQHDADALLRLTLALFIDFAHAQGLNAIELVGLMSDPLRELLEAAEFLLEHEDFEPSPAASFDTRADPWGDAPAFDL